MTDSTECSASDVWQRMQFVHAIDGIDAAVAHQLENLRSGTFAPPGGGTWSGGWWTAIQMGQIPGSAFHRLREAGQLGLPVGEQIHLDIEVMATLFSLAEKADTPEEAAELWKLATEKGEGIRGALAGLNAMVLSPSSGDQPESVEPEATQPVDNDDADDQIPDPAEGMLAWLCKGVAEEPLPKGLNEIRRLEEAVAAIRLKVERMRIVHDGIASDFPWIELKAVFAVLGADQRTAAQSCERAWWSLCAASRELAGHCDVDELDRRLDLVAAEFVGNSAFIWREAPYGDLIQQFAGLVRVKLESRVVGWLERVLAEVRVWTTEVADRRVGESGGPLQAQDAITATTAAPFWGLRVNRDTKTITRDGCDASVCLFASPEQWNLFSMLFAAAGTPMPNRDVDAVKCGSSGATRQNRTQLNRSLCGLGIKVSGRGVERWILAESAELSTEE